MIAAILISLLLAAFFSGMEIAFVSSNKIYLEIEKKQDSFLSQILSKLTEKPSKFIAAMLVGYNLALVVYGFFISVFISGWISGYGLSGLSGMLIKIGVSALVVIVTAGFLPKVLFQVYANSLIRIFALPAYLFYFVFYWISTFIIWISDSVLRKLLGASTDPVQLFFSKVELGNYINEQISGVDHSEEVDSEIQIFQNALEFSNVKARDVMTPRTEISAIDIFAPVEELRQLFIETGYSKIIVYQDSIDDIIGYVHSFELFRQPRSIKSVLIRTEFVPQTIYIKDVMDLLTKKRKSVAVVLDEYGGTAGILTVEDIVEELFGEIEDEHDDEETFTETELSEGVYLFSTRLDVEYLNEKYNFGLPENDAYSTLGGCIVHSAKSIPQTGEQISIGRFLFTIEEASPSKIALVRMAAQG